MHVKPTATLKEIAKEADLSITTVWRVLRSWGEASNETIHRVLNMAKEMKYGPNMLVRGIQSGKTGTTGVMVPPYDSFWTQVLFGIHDELIAHNHVFINTWCQHQKNNEEVTGEVL